MKKKKKTAIRFLMLVIIIGIIASSSVINIIINKMDAVQAKTSNKTASGIITIKCTGDSVTAGYGYNDMHDAVIGGETYPSYLYALLKHNGKNVVVENAGHGGENTNAIISRLGGATLVTNEDIVFDNNGYSQPIDYKITSVYNQKLQKTVRFKHTSTDVNPVTIDAKKYEVVTVNSGKGNANSKTYLHKLIDDDTAVIKAGTKVELGGSRNNTVNIIFAGINDERDVTIDDYVAMLKNGAAVNGGKYIIIGPHSAIYNKTNFVEGRTKEERRNNYRKRMIKEFGSHFIDLNTEWYERTLSVALANGFFKELTQEQLDAVQMKLNNRIIPAEFTYTKNEGDVHLNNAGYLTIALIVYEKLLELKYI